MVLSIQFSMDFSLPSLQSVYLMLASAKVETHSHLLSPDSSRSTVMVPAFADVLRNKPRLHIIHEYEGPDIQAPDIFDRLDRLLGHTSKNVRSLRHGSEELLHVRIAPMLVEASDQAVTAGEAKDATHSIMRPYTSRNGDSRSKRYVAKSHTSLQDLVDFRGLAVPFAVLEGMREAEGASEEAWRGRDVAVGDKGWKVLFDWVAEQGASGMDTA
jgi:hypothetical protein